MGIRNKARRQAKAKERRARARGPAGRPGHATADGGDPREAVAMLVLTASMICRHDQPAAADARIRLLAELYDAGAEDDIDAAIVALLNDRVAAVWEEGWQPADIARVLRRTATETMAFMAIDVMAAHLATFSRSTVDDRFPAQLAWLGADADSGLAAGFVARWARRIGTAESLAAVALAFELVDALSHLPELPLLCPPPGHARRADSPARETYETKVLERVRGLLAKAESSEYGAEADALTAKAQELMTRHSIDQALLAGRSGAVEDPTGQRIGLDNPYEAEKAALLDRIASANRCKAIWSRHLGFVTVLGYPADLRAVDLLFTSLLTQSTRAVLREGRRRTGSGSSRTRSFRQAFLTAFAVRIGERLNGVVNSGVRAGAAEDARLLPVLAGRGHKVLEYANKLFPDLVDRHHGTYAYDREGWAVGTRAADLAVLTAIPSVGAEQAAAGGHVTQDALFPLPHRI